MKNYTVTIKEVYTYPDVPANSKEEAIDKILDLEWRNHDEQDRPLQTEAEEN